MSDSVKVTDDDLIPFFAKIVTDPKQAYQKAQELWSYLSENEPENQARPVTMEQLVVLLTRETARRMVHFINYTRFTMTTIPDRMKQTQTELMHQFLLVTNSLLEMARLKTGPVYQEVAQLRERIAGLYEEVQDHATNGLVIMDRSRVGRQLTRPSSRTASLAATNNFNHEFHLTFQFSIHSIVTPVSSSRTDTTYMYNMLVVH